MIIIIILYEDNRALCDYANCLFYWYVPCHNYMSLWNIYGDSSPKLCKNGQKWLKLVDTTEINPKYIYKSTSLFNSIQRKTIEYKFATQSNSYVCLWLVGAGTFSETQTANYHFIEMYSINVHHAMPSFK